MPKRKSEGGGRPPVRPIAALEDQQSGELIMSVPARIIGLIAGLGFIAAWLGESEPRTLGHES